LIPLPSGRDDVLLLFRAERRVRRDRTGDETVDRWWTFPETRSAFSIEILASASNILSAVLCAHRRGTSQYRAFFALTATAPRLLAQLYRYKMDSRTRHFPYSP